MSRVRVVALLISIVGIVLPLWSQNGTSTIRGTVTDQQGRVVAGAAVTLTNVANNGVRKTTTTDTGAYVFDLITPADYRIEVDAKGFREKLVDNVKALIGKQTESNIQLEVGASTEVVEVKASAQEAVINTQDGTLGNNFESLQITQLPLEARNISGLLSLQPGATKEGYVTGARADQSNVTLDGVDINNAQTANVLTPLTTNSLVIGQLASDRDNITAGPVLRLNAEAIEEFRVTTANGNANQGRSGGSQINLQTKAGSNDWHGAAFELYRGTIFEANDWFSNHAVDANGNSAPLPRTPLVRNTFGGAFGGPILKDKAFFFYSYEGRHDATAFGVTQVVPLASLGQGIVKYQYCVDAACDSTNVAQITLTPASPGPYPQAGIDQAALTAIAAAAAKYPANDSTQGDQLNTSGFRFNAPEPTTLNSHVAKLDFNINSKQTAFVRANVIYDHQAQQQWLPGAPIPETWNHPWGYAVGHTWTIKNNWVNNFRFGYTRQAFSNGGDSNGNDISFRFVFQPTGQQHTVSRVTPVYNWTDDISWIRGNHNIQFGVNVRKINNIRVSTVNAFDNALTNPSYYTASGAVLSNSFQSYLAANNLPGGQNGQSLANASAVQNAASALIGRYSQFTANYTYGKDGTLLPFGSPTNRDFATQAYEGYVQDTWKARKSLTLTLGLRYDLERPVYETGGFEVQPTVPLGTYFADRLTSSRQGQNFVTPITINRSGPANGGKPMYNWDYHEFQPRLAFAWSLDGGDGFFGRLFGNGGKSVIRGGFAMTNDYYGQALAVNFDLNNSLGFTSNYTTPPNTYGIGVQGQGPNLGPLFNSFNDSIRPLAPAGSGANLVFPLTKPDNLGTLIEQSLDSNLHAPTEYVWNLTFERQVGRGGVFTASYIGRAGRSLLAQRDVAAFNDLRDPKSGMDWYTAATMLEKQSQAGVPLNQIASIPYFDDVLPANYVGTVNNVLCGGPCLTASDTNTQAIYEYHLAGLNSGNDWTTAQFLTDLTLGLNGPNPNAFGIDTQATLFEQPQWGALSTWSTIGNSNYNAMALSYRQRISSLTLDFNYTGAHSLDDSSGLQTALGYDTSPFIINPIKQGESYASSDFDIRHTINANAVWAMPFGKGKTFLSTASPAMNAILGGWQLSGIFRWNTGLPLNAPIDDARWATNWNVQSYVTPIKPIRACPSKPAVGPPKLFGSCADITQVYQNYRNAYPGEVGPRNLYWLPGYVDLDLGLGKTWNMPWSESHQLQLRWDVFNVTNTQHFGTLDLSRTGWGVTVDPAGNAVKPPSTPNSNFANFISPIQGAPRVMQVGMRYSF